MSVKSELYAVEKAMQASSSEEVRKPTFSELQRVKSFRDQHLPPGPEIDYKNPNYAEIYDRRIKFLTRIRANPQFLPTLKEIYRKNPVRFINDWGCTVDPRKVEIGQPVIIPFILFDKQADWINWVLESWKAQRPGVTVKSRESGLSWTAIAFACTMCLFNEGFAIGFGSRKEEYVDKSGDPKALFWKAREFIRLLPIEFTGDFNPDRDAFHMRIMFRKTNSVITGEAGSSIGRGDRTSIYFVDEAAFLEQPESIEKSLSQTTNCRIDISTPNGLGNPFHRKCTNWPKERIFTFHWRDDPRKDDKWYEKQQSELDPVTIAQELDIDFAASVEGVLIPSAWVQAAIDAHKVLNFNPTGMKIGALDIADEGADLNAFCAAHGVVILNVEEWKGKDSDIFSTVERAFNICDRYKLIGFRYDGDGMGAGVKGDARVINERRKNNLQTPIRIEMFRGSSAVVNPTRQDVQGRKNEDHFANYKAQSWWALRVRFQNTFRAVKQGLVLDYDELISIPSSLKCLNKLCSELSQPTFTTNGAGKKVIDKAPDGTRSPNLADAVMIRFAPARPIIVVSKEAAENISRRTQSGYNQPGYSQSGLR